MNDSLKLFETETLYNEAKPDFVYPTVSYVKDVNSVFYMTKPLPLHKQPIKAVFYDSASSTFVKLNPDEINSSLPSTYTPIGVEVIPAEHDVYGTGQAGIMSLVEMSYTTPDTGSSSNQGMYWGGYEVDTSLPNLDTANYIGIDGQLNNNTVQGSDMTCILPSDSFITSVHGTPLLSLDGSSYYFVSSGAEIGQEGMWFGPSPYNADGSRNEAYYTTASPALATNALSDFDGVGNTAVLTELATSQSDWKTADSITNSYSAGYYPAACCAWRFHTAGTNQGQWYLPACGEMGYVINRLSAINETINKIISVYSNAVAPMDAVEPSVASVVAVAVHTSNYYWSSSEYSASNARRLYTDNGLVYSGGKNNCYSYVRAFLRV